MVVNGETVFPTLTADLLLLHPPAHFDFRQRRDIYFPFMSTSGAVPITPLYDYMPIGFKSLQGYLGERGYDVKIINLCTFLLKYPQIDIRKLIRLIDVRLIGIDLHWLVHVQGALEMAKIFKMEQVQTPVIIGGISATYYAKELIKYPFIDMVMRGYDTHQPMHDLLSTMDHGGDLALIPNLLWKSNEGEIHDNGLTYIPKNYGYGIDWSDQITPNPTNSLSISELISVNSTGCANDCGWCGGSRSAFKRTFNRKNTVARKPSREIRREFNMLNMLDGAERFHLYAANVYNEPMARMEKLLLEVGESPLRSVNYEQFYLTPDSIIERMVQTNNHSIITLSPESHDLKISKLAGRGVYTNEEMELWLENAFERGIFQVDIWYFIGMPEQDEKSVNETIEYCATLLSKFKGKRINPMICPMIPILDPGSKFFEEPDKHGYRIFYRSLEEHRLGMNRASVINRMNYETRWLSREQIIDIGYKAVKNLMQLKADSGILPKTSVRKFGEKIDDAREFIQTVHHVDCIEDVEERTKELERLGDDIQTRNELVFFSGVSNQAFPINRDIGERWFDCMGWKNEELDTVLEATCQE